MIIKIRPKKCVSGWYPELTFPNGYLVRVCEVTKRPDFASVIGMRFAKQISHKLKRRAKEIIVLGNNLKNGCDYITIADPKGMGSKPNKRARKQIIKIIKELEE